MITTYNYLTKLERKTPFFNVELHHKTEKKETKKQQTYIYSHTYSIRSISDKLFVKICSSPKKPRT
jgi:hypothetical protein